MSAENIRLKFYARPIRDKTIAERHSVIMKGLSEIQGALSIAGCEIPPAPECGDELMALYSIRLPTKGLRLVGDYLYRGERYLYEDRACYDENLRYEFKASNKSIDYRNVLNSDLIKVIEIFSAYKVEVLYGDYAFSYQGRDATDNPIYFKLKGDKSIDVDGRNNIYTLHPAQFWDAELCHRALGYGPEEVIARLKGVCPLVTPVLDGVYIVLNDDPKMTYETYVEMNSTIKPILGLI
ncbi:hypothetical protein [Herbaspirillum huttiense]|uniref:hypothetical protein n=1 Tax=Herbaspirillum huttiense TaxID=863372 RepID=UPI0031D889FD